MNNPISKQSNNRMAYFFGIHHPSHYLRPIFAISTGIEKHTYNLRCVGDICRVNRIVDEVLLWRLWVGFKHVFWENKRLHQLLLLLNRHCKQFPSSIEVNFQAYCCSMMEMSGTMFILESIMSGIWGELSNPLWTIEFGDVFFIKEDVFLVAILVQLEVGSLCLMAISLSEFL